MRFDWSRRFAPSLVALLISSPLLTACTGGSAPQQAGEPTTSGEKKSVLPVVNFQSPGPYKTVTVDGEEMKGGRFALGEYQGNLVRTIVGSDPKTFNYWCANDTKSSELAGLMFSGPVSVDPYSGDVVPDLAESLDVDKDGLTYTVKLRKGLKWSDGKPITAEDLAYTWNTIVAGGYGNSSLRDVTTIDGKSPKVTAVDTLTTKFVTTKPFAPFKRLLGIPIAPKHIVEPIIKGKDGRDAFGQLWASNCDPKSLVTSGPFVLSRFVPSQRVEFEPTKNYYTVNEDNKRLPYLQKITYLIVPEVNTNLLKFRAKEVDETAVRCRDAVDLLKDQDKENFKLYNLGQSIGTTFVMFNMNPRKNPKTGKPYVEPVQSAWFNDVNFRQAVNHAINRDNMVANYFKGVGFPLYTSEPPASPYFNKNLKPFKPDLEYSMSLLKKSGFVKKDDGKLYDKDGNRVEFDLTTMAGSTFYSAVGGMFVDDLAKLGMKVNYQELNFNIMSDKVSNSLDWQACLGSLSPGDPLEPNDGSNVYKTNGRMHQFDQRLPDEKTGIITVTDARPWEKRLDELFNEGAETLDVTKRHKIYDEYQQIIYDEAPFIYLCSPMTIIGARNTIQNYQPTQLSQSIDGFHNLDEIWKK